ncbi:MAG: hypothetical protein ACXAC7_01330 [Candidatus Hodarchaeales archaeon]
MSHKMPKIMKTCMESGFENEKMKEMMEKCFSLWNNEDGEKMNDFCKSMAQNMNEYFQQE